MKSARRSTPDLSGARWRGSTYSGGNNECVEIADDIPGVIPVRDSKRPTGPALVFPSVGWSSFVASVKRAEPYGT
jgi:hypothetical protein